MVTYSSISKPGSRPVNEDYIGGLRKANRYLFVLCDGLGGHGAGDVASSVAARAFAGAFLTQKGSAADFCAAAYAEAQAAVLAAQQAAGSRAGMRTTLVSLLIDGDRCSWSHIGDSRLYCFSADGRMERTMDHSVPQMLVMTGEIEESEIRFHPDRNRLLRALGDPDTAPRYVLAEEQTMNADTAFLLCSDGFWEYITEDAMEATLRQSATADDWLGRMLRIVETQQAGQKTDNYSAIAVMFRK